MTTTCLQPSHGVARARRQGKSCACRAAVDAFENEKEYLLNVDLPGVTREGLSLDVKNRELSIEATTDKDVRYGRTFTLPEGVDPERIEAGFKDGVLSVHIPKSEEVIPKKIEIEIN